MSEVLVSVIIPAYNSEKWINQAIESVINQSYTNIEIIVVNDGSTDGTQKILENLKQKYGIQYYNIENSGPANARNYGVSKSKGELIAFLDADDYWHADKIKRQVDYFKANSCSLLLTNLIKVNQQNNFLQKFKKSIPVTKKQQTISLFCGEITQNTPTIMVSRKVFDDVGGFNTNLIHKEDHFFLMSVADKYGIELLEEYLVYRREWKYSMSSDYKKVSNSPEDIISYFNKTRLPFYHLALKQFPYLEKYYNSCVGMHYYRLSHILYEYNFIKEAREVLKKSMRYNKTSKGLIKMTLLYLPAFLRNKVLKLYYKS